MIDDLAEKLDATRLIMDVSADQVEIAGQNRDDYSLSGWFFEIAHDTSGFTHSFVLHPTYLSASLSATSCNRQRLDDTLSSGITAGDNAYRVCNTGRARHCGPVSCSIAANCSLIPELHFDTGSCATLVAYSYR